MFMKKCHHDAPSCQHVHEVEPHHKIALITVLAILAVVFTGGLALAGYFFFKNFQLSNDEIE